MRRRALGRTGLEVSEIGFGAWAIGGNAHGNSYGPTKDADSIDAVRKARGGSEKLEEKLTETPRGATTRDKRKYRRARFAAMRARIELSQCIRRIEFTEAVKRRLAP